jgi:PAS domain S-box-containing protein
MYSNIEFWKEGRFANRTYYTLELQHTLRNSENLMLALSQPELDNIPAGERSFRWWLPDSRLFVAGYTVVLAILGAVIVLDPTLDILWTLMMVPVVLAALVYRRRVYLAMLAAYLGASLCVIAAAAEDAIESVQTLLVFLAAVALVAEVLYRMTAARERAREELRKSEQRFRSLSAMAPVGIFQMDAEGSCTYTNARYHSILGLSDEESCGQGWMSIVHPEDSEATLEQWSAAVRGGQGFSREFRVLTPEGVRWVHASTAAMRSQAGRVSGYVGTLEDITERKNSAQDLQRANDELEIRVVARTAELRHSEERFSKAFHASPTAITISSLVDGRFIDANESFLLMLGYSLPEVIGKTAQQLDIWADPRERSQLMKVMRRQGSVRGWETKLRTKTGQVCDVLFSAEPMTAGGEPCILSIAIDITERKAYELRLQEYADSQTMLLSQLMTAQEAERRRLSMDIHDGPLQSLGVSMMALDRAIRRRDRGEHEIADRELRNLRTTLSETVAEVRAVLADLSLEILGSYGLESAMRSHIDRFEDVTGVTVTIQNSLMHRLPADIELLMYRLSQEALANIRKHAQAKNVRICLEVIADILTMTITDDGRGFDVDAVLQQQHKDGEKIGLRSMSQRIRAVQGDLFIFSAPGEGASLEFRCPIPACEPVDALEHLRVQS